MGNAQYEKQHINIERYVYKLIPDYAYIDYAERKYWSTHTTRNVSIFSSELYEPTGEFWFDIINLMCNSAASNEYKTIGYGRCLLISPVRLEFVSHVDEIICPLKKYGDRYVYACFSSEDELFRQNFAVRGVYSDISSYAQYNSSTGKVDGDLPYLFVMRF